MKLVPSTVFEVLRTLAPQVFVNKTERYVNVVMGISKFFGEMPWFYYIQFLYNEFCEIESYGLPVFFLLSIRQMSGTLTPASSHGWRKKIEGETPPERLIRVPFILIFFFSNFIVLSALAHKEMRFITSLIQIGQIAQAYMITWCFDTREVLVELIKMRKGSKEVISWVKWLSGWGIKSFALFVVVKQEQGRLSRWVFNNRYKYDSGLESYNLFSGRSSIIGDEQP